MKLVVGLGNPGEEYRGTRHNVGAEAVERLGERAGAVFRRRWRLRARAARAPVGGRTLTLARPQTFMNVSGAAVAALMRWEKCAPADLLVVTDDIALPLGRIRIRKGGGAGGHKGLESVIGALGTEEFPRLRIGVGRPAGGWVPHVLGRFGPGEDEEAARAIERAAEAVEEIARSGIEAAMNRFNPPAG
ncbi:MAG: aminoacyl-tRNA hydrolase [bacterium]|nr:aminoacyl-tRNA hydrolase [bacterium]